MRPSPADPLFAGIDVGSSGARAVVIDETGATLSEGRASMAEFGTDPRNPMTWAAAVESALGAALGCVARGRVAALAVDGTSGTLVAVDARGEPLALARMYDDPCEDSALLAAIDAAAPAESAARGPTSGLARAALFARLKPARILHQADWIAFRFSGRFLSDANNALKTGFDPVVLAWPAWIERVGVDAALLPEVVAPGAMVGTITPAAARAFGLPADVGVAAGTTDGCASFLATGASRVGDGVTALGASLTLKLLSDRPIFAPRYGVYSHRLLDMWLAGGASNSGGAALLAHFPPSEIEALTPLIDPEADSGLDYYPLTRKGERFPFADPDFAPRMAPRPERREQFLQAILEGVAGIEALGYRRLADLGAPRLVSMRTVGGGARNPAWTRIRERKLGVPFLEPISSEAAYGAALLARRAWSG
ncbi:xylulokinase [Roseiarcus fermentans]|uniref:Xylulokinase n=1 Tax=Roseiarcus fermentans TaxID=1473586 RepID=A0A366FV36_9HYPH|nr:FGGY-family carbohydrate kinase [Roseiarcus fermentans]RBP18371.1 xylulokinase [Roseiarcus fermentans]